MITGLRFSAFAFGRPVVNVPVDGEHVAKLDPSLERDGAVLAVSFDYEDFHDDGSGRIEVRFRTDRARDFHARLRGA